MTISIMPVQTLASHQSERHRLSTPEPRITVSIKRSSDGSRATGELNSLSLGFGIFQVWLFMAVYNGAKMFSPSELIPAFPFLPPEMASPVLVAFLLVGGIGLIAIGATNQLLLRFYVSKRALFAATLLCCLGTALLYGGCVANVGALLAMIAGAIMGIGSSLLFIIWGTTFARFQFATIVLNTAISYVVGISISVVCANWVPSPISGLITILLPLASMPILMNMIPRPYYQRHEEPIFRPLSANRVNEASFLARFGFPVLVVGITLGALRSVCIGQVLPEGSLTIQFAFGLSCITSLVIYVMAIAITKRGLFWDTLFRVVMPITMAGIASIALLVGNWDILASFFVSMGYVCLEIMLWVFFAGVAQQFRISPIFVFGIGRGLLEFGSVVGSVIVTEVFLVGLSETGLAQSALILAVSLSIGYAFLPRYREIKAMVSDPHAPQTKTEAPVQMWEGVSHDCTPIPVGGAIGAFGGTAVFAPIVNTTPLTSDVKESASPNDTEGAAALDEETDEEKGSFRRRCDELSEQYLLSTREKEVFLILAKGHNATFIQEQLCVSKSTAKTHINHIYKKMDIHTQQELLKMVEDRPRLSKRKQKAAAKEAAAKEAASASKDAEGSRKRGLRADIFGTR